MMATAMKYYFTKCATNGNSTGFIFMRIKLIALAIVSALLSIGCSTSNNSIRKPEEISWSGKGPDRCSDSKRTCVRPNPIQKVQTWIHTQNTHNISSTANVLFYDGYPISPIEMNSKDGMEDLPDSVWEGYYIGPIKKHAIRDIERIGHSAVFVYSSPDSFPYAYTKPILRSLTESGVRWIHIPIENNGFAPVEMMNTKEDEYIVLSGDSAGYNSIIQISRDSLRLNVNSIRKNPNCVFVLQARDQDKFSRLELNALSEALIREIGSKNSLQWIALDPHPGVSFRKISQIISALTNINNRKSLKVGLNISLYGIYVPW